MIVLIAGPAAVGKSTSLGQIADASSSGRLSKWTVVDLEAFYVPNEDHVAIDLVRRLAQRARAVIRARPDVPLPDSTWFGMPIGPNIAVGGDGIAPTILYDLVRDMRESGVPAILAMLLPSREDYSALYAVKAKSRGVGSGPHHEWTGASKVWADMLDFWHLAKSTRTTAPRTLGETSHYLVSETSQGVHQDNEPAPWANARDLAPCLPNIGRFYSVDHLIRTLQAWGV